jgi:hypothetical protein
MGVAILPASTPKPVDEAVVAPGTTLASLVRQPSLGLQQRRAAPIVTRIEARGDIMKLTAGVIGLAVLVLGAALPPSSALAKCPKDCKKQISTEFKTCKSACGKHDRTCKHACRAAEKAARTTCKTATDPTPPTCSPSGAFLL